MDNKNIAHLPAWERVILAIAPALILGKKVAGGMLRTGAIDLDITETFHATTMGCQFNPPIVGNLVASFAAI